MEARIEPLSHLSTTQLAAMGHHGYVSNELYRVIHTVGTEGASFMLQLTALETPYVKTWTVDADEWKTYRQTLRQGHSFGAYVNDLLVGFIVCEERSWNRTFYISNLLVAETYRGKGIGQQLIRQAIAHATAQNLRLAELETQNTNVPAIRFYQRQGFRITGLHLQLYDPRENGEEVALYMSYPLQPGH
jgi:ribosomal protein S18 acetylase RimI-like enzyme